MSKVLVKLTVNEDDYEIATFEHRTLLETLREDIHLTGTKHGCELGECGTCTVLINGKPYLSCLVLTVECPGRTITTIEGINSPLQQTFSELGAAQCGYCTPGFLLCAQVLLDKNPSPSREEIIKSVAGNLCRCTGYFKIFEAIELAAKKTNPTLFADQKPNKKRINDKYSSSEQPKDHSSSTG